MNKYLKLLALFLFITSLKIHAESATLIPAKEKSSDLEQERLTTIHTFRNKSGNELGNLYAFTSANSRNTKLYERLLISKTQNGKTSVLYEIYKTKFINRNGITETELPKEGFIGYEVAVFGKDYVVLSCCGENVSDDLTIEWNPNKKEFELQLTP